MLGSAATAAVGAEGSWSSSPSGGGIQARIVINQRDEKYGRVLVPYLELKTYVARWIDLSSWESINLEVVDEDGKSLSLPRAIAVSGPVRMGLGDIYLPADSTISMSLDPGSLGFAKGPAFLAYWGGGTLNEKQNGKIFLRGSLTGKGKKLSSGEASWSGKVQFVPLRVTWK